MDYETGSSGAHKNLQSPQVLPVPETLNRHSTAPFPSTAMPAESRIKRARKKPSLASMDSGDIDRPLQPSKRRVMVVADPSRESSIALQWALSHAILEHDELILLHVEASNPSRRGSALSAFLRRPASLGAAGNQQSHHQPALSSASSSSSSSSSGDAGEYDFLEGMRAACEAAHPKVRVQTERVEMEGRDKAAAILSQTKILGVDLLVIGQRRPGSYFLGCKLSGSMTGRGGLDTAEFLIEHCKCLCVGVQKKGQNAGYLLNTKTHKNFWLLA